MEKIIEKIEREDIFIPTAIRCIKECTDGNVGVWSEGYRKTICKVVKDNKILPEDEYEYLLKVLQLT